MKKFLTVILALICVFSLFSFAVYAADDTGIQPYYSRLTNINMGLTISGGTATIIVNAVTDYYTDDVYLTVYLQRNESGVWKTVGSPMYANGGWRADIETTVDDLASGYNYRLRVDVKDYNTLGYLLESVTEYSSEKYY